jgi:cold shock CspA family protein
MTSPRCDDCGKRFNNEYNLKLHEKHACDGDQRSTDTTESSGGTREHVAPHATGTVKTFSKDRGFGFVVTADLTDEGSDGTAYTQDVFVHLSNTDTTYLQEGDRLAFEVVETDDGLTAEHATVLERAHERDEPEGETHDPASRLRFGGQVDDTKYGVGKQNPTESDIESFDDERKFR